MDIPGSVFKSYDIRGLSPGEITSELAERLGRAVVVWSGATRVVVGKDMRATTPELVEALVRGITRQGATAIEVGLVTTPMFYFGVATNTSAECGVMVTASHNPAEYNGFKLVRAGAVPIGSGSGMEEIRDLVLKNVFPDVATPGGVEHAPVQETYINAVLALVPTSMSASLPIVIDAGNGMAGAVLPDLCARLGHTVTPLYWELDGTFPNHEANPLKEETLEVLKQTVREQRAALGVAYDGDADRIGFVDETGQVVPADLLAALLVPEVLRRHPETAVVLDVRCSRVLEEEIRAAGGRPVLSRVGHAFMKRVLKEEQACFGAELSAHYYFSDFYGVECSDLVLLLLIGVLTRTQKSLSELMKPLRRYSQSGELNFRVADTTVAMQAVREHFAAHVDKTIEIDGLRMEHRDWWISVRSSNTEPLLRLNVEGTTDALMTAQRDAAIAVIQKHAV